MIKFLKKISTQSISIYVKPSFFQSFLTSCIFLQINSGPKYSMGFFNKPNPSKNQLWITQSIKNCKRSQDIQLIIKQAGKAFNIIHLTAILDRIQQQNMIDIKDIVKFVTTKLKLYEHFLLTSHSPETVRTISNLICYLGNLKNMELNHIFSKLNYKEIFLNSQSLHKINIISGLIRLKLFFHVFDDQTQNISSNKLDLMEIVNEKMSFDEVLGIWYTYILEITKENDKINTGMITLLDKVNDGEMNLKIFSYTFVSYMSIKKFLKQPERNILFNFIKSYTPGQHTKNQKLRPHQFSFLLQAIKLYRKQSSSQLNIDKSNYCIKALRVNYYNISALSYITLRHLANCFKPLNETYGLSNQQIIRTIDKIIDIIYQQLEYIQKNKSKQNKYELNYKIDLLSLTSLFWKTNQCLKYSSTQSKEDIKSYNIKLIQFKDKIIDFIIKLDTLDLMFNKIQNNQLLMLFNGFVSLYKHVYFSFDDKFKTIALKYIMKNNRKFTLKEITLFYTYFGQLNIYNSQFCHFIRKNIKEKQHSSQFKSIPTANTILNLKTCLMQKDKNCLKCFQTIKSQQQSINCQKIIIFQDKIQSFHQIIRKNDG